MRSPQPVLPSNLRAVREKTQDHLDLQALHSVRSMLISRRTVTINQIRTFLIEQGIADRKGAQALRNSLLTILDLRRDEISERMHDIVIGFCEDWLWLDERIESITKEIEAWRIRRRFASTSEHSSHWSDYLHGNGVGNQHW